MKLGIAVDSTSDIPVEVKKKIDAEVVSLKVIWPNGTIEEDLIDADKDDFFRRLESAQELPRTSQPAIEDFIKAFRRLAERGYEAILGLWLSSKLSGTYSAAEAAAKSSPVPVVNVDTRSASLMITFLAMEARKLAQAGASLEEIVGRINFVRDNLQSVVFAVSDLKYLIKGGRLSKVKGFIASALKLVPMIRFTDDGQLEHFMNARGLRKAISKMVEVLAEFAGERRVRLAVAFAGSREAGEALLREAQKALNVVSEPLFNQLGKVLGTHTGPGLFGAGVQIVE